MNSQNFYLIWKKKPRYKESLKQKSTLELYFSMLNYIEGWETVLNLCKLQFP